MIFWRTCWWTTDCILSVSFSSHFAHSSEWTIWHPRRIIHKPTDRWIDLIGRLSPNYGATWKGTKETGPYMTIHYSKLRIKTPNALPYEFTAFYFCAIRTAPWTYNVRWSEGTAYWGHRDHIPACTKRETTTPHCDNVSRRWQAKWNLRRGDTSTKMNGKIAMRHHLLSQESTSNLTSHQ